MRHDRDPARRVDARERLGQSREHGDLVLDPEREKVARSCRHLNARHDRHRARALGRELAQRKGTADVVVIGQRDHVEPDALRGVKDFLDRRKTIAQVAVELKISSTHVFPRPARRPSTVRDAP